MFYKSRLEANNKRLQALIGVVSGGEPKYSEGLEYWVGKDATVFDIGTCTDDIVMIPAEYQGVPVTSINGIQSGSFKQIIMPDTIKYVDLGISYLSNLERVEFGSGLEAINYWCFNDNPKCKEYDFTKCIRVPALYFDDMFQAYSFEGMPSDCKLIVPAELCEEWKNATNWTVYSNYIVAEGMENIQEKTVNFTENGSYEVSPDAGYLLSKVLVDVAVPQKEEQTKTLNVASNGDYYIAPDAGKTLSEVFVCVNTPEQKEEQEKTVTVTENGSVNVTPDSGKVLSKVTVVTAVHGELAALIGDTATEITIPDGVTKIRRAIFSYAPNLVSVEIPESVTVIERDAFLGSTALATLVFPSGVTELTANVANSCTALTSAVMLGDIMAVRATAFNNCRSCLTFDFTACTSVPTLAATSAFTGINASAKIKVPSSLLSAWKTATNWATYADYIVAG